MTRFSKNPTHRLRQVSNGTLRGEVHSDFQPSRYSQKVRRNQHHRYKNKYLSKQKTILVNRKQKYCIQYIITVVDIIQLVDITLQVVTVCSAPRFHIHRATAPVRRRVMGRTNCTMWLVAGVMPAVHRHRPCFMSSEVHACVQSKPKTNAAQNSFWPKPPELLSQYRNYMRRRCWNLRSLI